MPLINKRPKEAESKSEPTSSSPTSLAIAYGLKRQAGRKADTEVQYKPKSIVEAIQKKKAAAKEPTEDLELDESEDTVAWSDLKQELDLEESPKEAGMIAEIMRRMRAKRK